MIEKSYKDALDLRLERAKILRFSERLLLKLQFAFINSDYAVIKAMIEQGGNPNIAFTCQDEEGIQFGSLFAHVNKRLMSDGSNKQLKALFHLLCDVIPQESHLTYFMKHPRDQQELDETFIMQKHEFDKFFRKNQENGTKELDGVNLRIITCDSGLELIGKYSNDSSIQWARLALNYSLDYSKGNYERVYGLPFIPFIKSYETGRLEALSNKRDTRERPCVKVVKYSEYPRVDYPRFEEKPMKSSRNVKNHDFEPG